MANSYLEITLKVDEADRESAAGVYYKYKDSFLQKVKGANSKELLVRNDDVQVLHGFESLIDAQNYLTSDLFNKEVATALKPYLKDNPEIRIYTVA